MQQLLECLQKRLHHLGACFQPLATKNEPVANVINGNVQLYVHSRIPDNLQGIAEMVLDRLPKSLRVDFVTDTTNVYLKKTQLK